MTMLPTDARAGVLHADLQLVLQPIEQARGLPNALYTDLEAHAQECRQVFDGGWACAGFAKDVARPGDTYPVDFAGRPLLLVRGHDDVLRVFHNVCRHRGRTLIEAPISVKNAIVCPYHSWTYGLDGALVGTPHVGGVGKHTCPAFDKDQVRLNEVRSAVWFGLVFVDLSGAAEAFDEFISPLAARWRDFAEAPLVHGGGDSTITFELNCNWKFAVENYCEAYHLPWVHPDLNSYSPLEKHENITAAAYAGQFSESYAPTFPDGAQPFPNAPCLPAYWHAGAEYIALFPNVLLGLHRDHFFAVLVLPDGPDRTHERFEIFYFDDTVLGATFAAARTENRRLWKAVFAEDRDAVEAMQRGRRSPAYDGGLFSPVMDIPTHTFHSWIARAWLEGRTVDAAARPARA